MKLKIPLFFVIGLVDLTFLTGNFRKLTSILFSLIGLQIKSQIPQFIIYFDLFIWIPFVLIIFDLLYYFLEDYDLNFRVIINDILLRFTIFLFLYQFICILHLYPIIPMNLFINSDFANPLILTVWYLSSVINETYPLLIIMVFYYISDYLEESESKNKSKESEFIIKGQN